MDMEPEIWENRGFAQMKTGEVLLEHLEGGERKEPRRLVVMEAWRREKVSDN